MSEQRYRSKADLLNQHDESCPQESERILLSVLIEIRDLLIAQGRGSKRTWRKPRRDRATGHPKQQRDGSPYSGLNQHEVIMKRCGL